MIKWFKCVFNINLNSEEYEEVINLSLIYFLYDVRLSGFIYFKLFF